MLKRQFESLKPQRKWLDRQEQGDEADLNSFLDFSVQRSMGKGTTDPNLYWQPQSNENKVSKLLSYYDISQDDQALRNEIKNLPQSFDKLRKNYPTRHEFLASV